MSNVVSGSLPQPAPRHAAIRALLRAGDNDTAIVQLCAITVSNPDDLQARELLFDAFFQKRDWPAALALAEELNRRQPGMARMQKARIATLSNMKRFDDTIAQAQQYIAQHGEDLTILDALKVAHFYTGKTEEAIRHGQRALDLRDAEACRNPLPFALKEPAGPPSGRNVISFSLWGPKLFYTYGAMINLVLSRKVYPDWTCRFYIDATVPPACIAFLRENGAELQLHGGRVSGRRTVPALPGHERSDGRLFPGARLRCAGIRRRGRSRSAMDRQLICRSTSLRDHVMHNELVMGGVWAGRTDCGIDIVELMRRYFVAGPTAKYGHDQRMLGLLLWPLIRNHCLVHDRHYRLAGVQTVRLGERKLHFGAGYQDLDAVLREVDRLGIPRLS